MRQSSQNTAVRMTLAAAVSLLLTAQAFRPVFGQDTGNAPNTTIRSEEERTEERRRAAAAAREAEQRRLLEGRDVSFEEVLARPDDIDLNFRFAKTQIRRGDVRGAQGTLERLLLIAPQRVDIRLLYAIVLFRLDNMLEAEREIEAVISADMPDSLRRQLEGYLDQIKLRQRKTRFSFLGSFGWQHDWNRNGAPGSGELETIIGRAPLVGNSNRARDTSFQYFGRLSVTHDLGFQELHKLFFSISAYSGDQVKRNDLSVASLSGRLGGSIDLNPFTISPYVERRQIRLSNEPFINGIAGGVRVDYRHNRPINLFTRFRAERQKYFGIDESPASNLRTGPEYRTGVGADFVIGSDMRVTLEYSRARKEARTKYFSYFADEITVDHTWLLGKGAFLLSHFGWRLDQYDDFDPLVSTRTRRDMQYRARLTIGAPLQTILLDAELPQFFSNMTVSATGEYYRATSNITNFQYSNRRFGLNISKRLDF